MPDSAALLAWGGRELGTSAGGRLEAELLLAHALGVPREAIYARWGEPVDAGAGERYRGMVSERAATRCPVAYLTGEKVFAGLRLAARRGVFIPRPETEGLVELIGQWWRTGPPPGVIAEPCCGSGAVAVALAARLGVVVLATDLAEDALALTAENAERAGVSGLVRAFRGPLLAPLGALSPRPRVAAVVCNPPYVPTEAIAGLDPDVRDFEPVAALDGGADGLETYRRLLPEAGALLLPGGLLALEIGAEQAAPILGLLGAEGCWTHSRVLRDAAGCDRYALAERSGSSLPAGLS